MPRLSLALLALLSVALLPAIAAAQDASEDRTSTAPADGLVRRGGITARFVGGEPVFDSAGGGEWSTSQNHRGAVRQLVRAPRTRPAAYLARHSGAQALGTRRVCGQNATSYRIEMAQQVVRGWVRGSDGVSSHPEQVIAARTMILLLVPQGAGLVALWWSVPAADRSRLQAEEERFLSSLRCH